jgi:lipoprotein-anchoring transpeptidase ErfK/SrfK
MEKSKPKTKAISKYKGITTSVFLRSRGFGLGLISLSLTSLAAGSTDFPFSENPISPKTPIAPIAQITKQNTCTNNVSMSTKSFFQKKLKIQEVIVGGKKSEKKKYPTQVIDGKRVSIVPVEDVLMQKEVTPPSAPQEKGVSIRVSLSNQRAWLYIDGKPSLITSITPGKPSTPTPKGKFHVISKHRNWTSTIYHVPMNYFLRLDPGYFGLHQGPMRLTAASHGCVRLPQKEASEFFERTPVGTPVWIE